MIGLAGIRRSSLGRFAVPAAVVALAILAGAAMLDENRARYLRLPPAVRGELLEALRRFDRELRPEQQRAARAIDERLNSMAPEERDAHLAVLRRYHNWLASLSEKARDDLLSRPTTERLDRMRSLFAKYPPPSAAARSPLDFIQTGGTGIFEVASLCKTWVAISPRDRARIDGLPVGDRLEELRRLGREREIPRELVPDDFSLESWIDRAEARVKELRDGATNPSDWIGKLEGRINAAAERQAEGRPRVPPFLHRLAVNLYLQEHKPAHPVDPIRLSRFLEAMPAWIQSTFHPFPSDEAKKRLTLVYRLVFPHPEEFQSLAGGRPSPAPAPPAAPGQPGPPVAPAPPKPGQPTPF